MFLRNLIIILVCFFFFLPATAFAQSADNKDKLFKAEVVKIVATGEVYIDDGKKNPYQTVIIKLLDGKNRGHTITVDNGKASTIRENQLVHVGDKVVVLQLKTPTATQYQIVDKYRLDRLLPIILLFFLLVLGLSRLKGIGAIAGLLVSIIVIMQFIIPRILAGDDPLVISIVGSLLIMMTSIYLAHGFSRKTHIALAATAISLLLTGILAYLFVDITKLSGLGTDDAFSLQFGQTGNINFRGLLLGGIIIGALGVLDDITTSLAAVIEEIKKANPAFTFWQLAQSGLRVGSEHISSLVNTLVLAYAGAGLPLFLFLILNPSGQPIWAILNSELIVEEIVRTLAGSIGLILAVPITTFLAAWFVTRQLPVHAKHKK